MLVEESYVSDATPPLWALILVFSVNEEGASSSSRGARHQARQGWQSNSIIIIIITSFSSLYY